MHQLKQSTQIEHTLIAWREQTLAGNEAFSHGHWDQASHCYQHAYHHAQKLLAPLLHTYSPQQDYSLLEQYCPAYVVAAHNLADCYLRLQQQENALTMLSEAHLTIGCLASHSDHTLQVLAQHHLRKTHQQLVEFARLYGTHPELNQLIHQQLNPSSVGATLH